MNAPTIKNMGIEDAGRWYLGMTPAERVRMDEAVRARDRAIRGNHEYDEGFRAAWMSNYTDAEHEAALKRISADIAPPHDGDCPMRHLSSAECLCDRSKWCEEHEGGAA